MPVKQSITTDFIEKLSKIMEQYDLSRIEWQENDVRLKLNRGQTILSSPMVVPQAPMAVAPASASPVHSATKIDPHLAKPDQKGPGDVLSPMVGTAYLSPSPDAAVFVKKGDHVHEGQTLLIVEAMKVMNQISSPISGVVEAIHIEDSQPVEYDDLLITVKPA